MAQPKETTRRVVLLGKTGSGKSSLANTLFGEEDAFKVSCLANSGTNQCLSKTKTINGRNIQLIDTPGFFNTNLNSDELKSELLKCITECAPGPHAFLLVLRERFTVQEEAVVDQMVKYFGEEALKYTTVVFTHGDQLKKGMKIEDWMKGNKSLKNLVDKCGGRCCVINNNIWNEDQIEQLLKKIDQTMKDNGGGYYTNEMLQMVQKKIEETKAEIKKYSPNIPEEILNERATEAVNNFLYDNLTSVAVAVILAFFLGAVGIAALPKIFTSERRSLVNRCAELAVSAVAAVVALWQRR